jgi:hypothetical protein
MNTEVTGNIRRKEDLSFRTRVSECFSARSTILLSTIVILLGFDCSEIKQTTEFVLFRREHNEKETNLMEGFESK